MNLPHSTINSFAKQKSRCPKDRTPPFYRREMEILLNIIPVKYPERSENAMWSTGAKRKEK